jgi:hypothetical protein
MDLGMSLKLLRRTHMYLALFLAPWVLLYALSTFAMNHRHWFRGEPPKPPTFIHERDFAYDGSFPPGASPQQIALQLLTALELDGAFRATRQPGDGKIVVHRLSALEPRRITFDPTTHRGAVERQQFEGAVWLEQMHRRRGYQHDFAADDFWAFSVDLFIVAILFWALSGVWLWWGLKATRAPGACALVAGVALFALFLVLL